MKKLFLTLIVLCMVVVSCSVEGDSSVTTFQKIEKEFQFVNPLSEKSKKLILKKIGDAERYRKYLVEVFNNRKEHNLEKSGGGQYYKCLLEMPEGFQTITCPTDETVLSRSMEYGLDLPYSCGVGACSTCVGQMQMGSIDQSEQTFLDEDQLNEGYVLLCVAYPRSDVKLKTHMEENL